MGQQRPDAPRARIAAAVFVMAFSTHAAADAPPAPSAPLGLSTATALALERQPLLEKFDAEARAARDAAISAAQLPDPQLVAGIQDLPIQGRDAGSLSNDTDTQTVVGISQTFPRATKRRLKGELRTQEAARIDDERALAALTIERDVANAWIDVWREERARALAAATLHEGELQLRSVE